MEGDGVITCAGLQLRGVPLPQRLQPGDRVVLGVRPQDVDLEGSGPADGRARVEVVEPLGPAILCHSRLDGHPLRVLVPAERPVVEGDELSLRLRRDRLHLFHPDGPRLL
jgi:ABC-type sugar transport system ATPase subunit